MVECGRGSMARRVGSRFHPGPRSVTLPIAGDRKSRRPARTDSSPFTLSYAGNTGCYNKLRNSLAVQGVAESPLGRRRVRRYRCRRAVGDRRRRARVAGWRAGRGHRYGLRLGQAPSAAATADVRRNGRGSNQQKRNPLHRSVSSRIGPSIELRRAATGGSWSRWDARAASANDSPYNLACWRMMCKCNRCRKATFAATACSPCRLCRA